MSVELVASCWSGRCWLPRRHLPAALFLLPFANFPKDLSIPSSPSLQIIPLVRVYEFSLPTPITILFSLSCPFLPRNRNVVPRRDGRKKSWMEINLDPGGG